MNCGKDIVDDQAVVPKLFVLSAHGGPSRIEDGKVDVGDNRPLFWPESEERLGKYIQD